jgi:uncharacterized iron-regulated membrane protein
MSTQPRKLLSPGFVRRMLSGHSVLGLTAAVLMYILCVSGTFAVLYEELGRWEQPAVRESPTYSPEAVQRAAEEALAAAATPPDHLYISLPTSDVPRLVATAEEQSWLADENGALTQEVQTEWTDFLVDLHIFLNLPETLGLTLVGILGVLLAALIVSGLLAHPRIFKDAFALRWTKSLRLQQVDLHNRLAVWSAPMHLAIAVTGAAIGLSTALAFAVGTALYGGDIDKVYEPVYGAEPPADKTAAPLIDIAAALHAWHAAAPNLAASTADAPSPAAPLPTATLVTVHEPGTRGQFVQLDTDVPRRLVYWDTVNFTPDSSIAGTLGFADGPLGKQVEASLYSLHFGSFGGIGVKLAYLAIGTALCVVTASGFNVWLIRRRQAGRPAAALERLWTAAVWGVPLGLALAAVLEIAAGIPPALVFWSAIVLAAIGAWRTENRARLSRMLRAACAAAFAAVVAVHAARFGAASFGPAALTVNVLFAALAVMFAATVGAGRSTAASAPRAAAGVTRRDVERS